MGNTGTIMQVNLPPKVRLWIYIIVVMGTAVIVPLNLSHVVNDVVMTVWNSVAAAASLLAAINVPSVTK